VELEPIPGQLVVSAPDGATLNVDGRVISATAMSEPVDLPAGRHLVVVSARGREPLVEQLEITRGQSVALTADLPMTSQRIGSYVLFIGAGALLAAGGAAAALALDAESSAEALEMKRAGGTALTVAEAQRFGALVSERDDYVRLGTAAAITGAGAALTGMFLFLFDDPEPPRAPLLSPMTTDGGGLGAVGTLTW
jgi:hypothetical protein